MRKGPITTPQSRIRITTSNLKLKFVSYLFISAAHSWSWWNMRKWCWVLRGREYESRSFAKIFDKALPGGTSNTNGSDNDNSACKAPERLNVDSKASLQRRTTRVTFLSHFYFCNIFVTFSVTKMWLSEESRKIVTKKSDLIVTLVWSQIYVKNEQISVTIW